MRLLCLDIGNTSTHPAFVHGPGLSLECPPTVMPIADIPTAQLAAQLPDLVNALAAERLDGLAFSSVVPVATAALRAALASMGCTLPVFQLTWQHCPDLPLLVDEPRTVGQDRIAAGLAAKFYHPLPSIVLDMGTAVTCDWISERGYEGGLIAPGLAIMASYMHEKTAQLPLLDPSDLRTPPGLGRNTVDQMKQGSAAGFAGMIGGLIAWVSDEMARSGIQPACILATGGTAKFLPETLRSQLRYADTLTVEGIYAGCVRWHSQASV
ncbi:MAG: type III pantothenate kinase [Verrucomicrobiota bacterium]|nr:type III pantothenate kinase [Verrucomicrobiota bacterium]